MNTVNEKAKILIVDDEEEILDLIVLVLRRDYQVFRASSGEEAIRIIDEQDLAVVLSDQWMQGMTGVDILTYSHRKRPDTGRILLTGLPDFQVVKDAINKGHIHRFVSKPWEVEELRNILTEEIGRHTALVEHEKLMGTLVQKNEELLLANEQVMAAKRRSEELNREYKEQSKVAIELSEKFAKAHIELLEAQEEIEKKNEQLEKANQKLEKLSITDGLTGFYNYRYLDELLDNEIGRAKRYDLDLTCIMIDLDDFKMVNDNYGHLYGDKVLRTCAKIIQNNIRDTDFPARYGGDEFFVVLPHTDIEKAQYLADRIFNDIKEYSFSPKENVHYVQNLSVGLATFVAESMESKEDLIKEVDVALYNSKRAGKNRISVSESAIKRTGK